LQQQNIGEVNIRERSSSGAGLDKDKKNDSDKEEMFPCSSCEKESSQFSA
jgi:hypothetical protein